MCVNIMYDTITYILNINVLRTNPNYFIKHVACINWSGKHGFIVKVTPKIKVFIIIELPFMKMQNVFKANA